MKKFCLLCVVLVTLATTLTGCNSMNRALEDAVSERHSTLLIAGDSDVQIEAVGGKIESNYGLDGQHGDLVDFVCVMVVTNGEEVSVEFLLGDKQYSEKLLLSPISNKFYANVEGSIEGDTLSMTVTVDGESRDYSLNRATSSNFDPLDKLKESFEQELAALFDGKKFNCEIFVRLVKNEKDESNMYYWCVVVYKPDNTFFAIMINSQTGEVVSRKQ